MPRARAKREKLVTRPPLQRMLHIHNALQAGKYPNCTGLAAELEVSTRSIARDLDFLRDRLQLPVAYDEAKHGYFYTEEVSAFPTMTISEGELLALVVAEKAMKQYRGTSFEKPLMNALSKLSETLPDTISLNLSQWNQSISFRTSAESVVDLERFESLAQATAKRQQLILFYRKPGQSEAEERTVDPYHLANVNGEWFLFAYDHLRKAIRTFVPARIERIVPTGKSFTRNEKFSVEKELRNSFGVHSGDKEIEVVIWFERNVADVVQEKRWHPSQRIRVLPGGRVELKLTLSSLVEIERWILSWGGNAQVIEPKELVQNVRQAAERMFSVHANGLTRAKVSAP